MSWLRESVFLLIWGNRYRIVTIGCSSVTPKTGLLQKCSVVAVILCARPCPAGLFEGTLDWYVLQNAEQLCKFYNQANAW